MFKLDQSNFELDKNFRFSFENGLLNLDVVANREKFKTLTKDEGQPFSWAIYPPKFYIHNLPLPSDTDLSNFEYVITVDDIDEYEIDLYIMEYCTVFPCKIVGKNGNIIIEGSVHDLGKELVPLRIQLNIT